MVVTTLHATHRVRDARLGAQRLLVDGREFLVVLLRRVHLDLESVYLEKLSSRRDHDQCREHSLRHSLLHPELKTPVEARTWLFFFTPSSPSSSSQDANKSLMICHPTNNREHLFDRMQHLVQSHQPC
jgi:hypothetical protein